MNTPTNAQSIESGLDSAARGICDILNHIDHQSLQAEVQENPSHYARMIGALIMLAEWHQKKEQQAAELQKAEAQKRKETERAGRPPGFPLETVQMIERKLRLFS